MNRNIIRYIRKVSRKYPYKINVPRGSMLFGTLPLSDKAQRLVLKEIDRHLKDSSQMTKSRYRFLLNLKAEYTENDGLYSIQSAMTPGDFDGDNLKINMIIEENDMNSSSSLIFGDSKIISRSYADKLLSGCDVQVGERISAPSRDILRGSMFNQNTQPLVTPHLDRLLTGYEAQENICNHRFSNNESSIITIGEGKCRCEKCNREFSTDIIMDEDIVDESKVIKAIKNLDLKALFKDSEED